MEVALHRLRMVGFGIIAAVVVIDALQVPIERWRSLKHRIATRLDPLDAAEGTFVGIVADLLSAIDEFVRARTPA